MSYELRVTQTHTTHTCVIPQVLGKVPTISIDKTDGCQMYLSKDSIATEIISAKSSEMNVLIPTGDDFVSITTITYDDLLITMRFV